MRLMVETRSRSTSFAWPELRQALVGSEFLLAVAEWLRLVWCLAKTTCTGRAVVNSRTNTYHDFCSMICSQPRVSIKSPLLSSAFGHIRGGKGRVTRRHAAVNTTKKTYTAYPPIQLSSSDVANSEVDAAGPTARTTDAIICAIPLTAPSERLLGAEDET